MMLGHTQRCSEMTRRKGERADSSEMDQRIISDDAQTYRKDGDPETISAYEIRWALMPMVIRTSFSWRRLGFKGHRKLAGVHGV